MSRAEQAIFTNLCMVYDDAGNILVEDRRDPDWPGICFPGGHVEKEESFTEAAVRETFEETGLTITDPRLVEQNYGIYEGMDRQTPGFLANKRHFAYRYPQGESMMDVCHRIYGLLEDIKRDHEGKNVLLVCHGGVMRLIRSYFEDMTNDEYFHYSEPNASVREFEL